MVIYSEILGNIADKEWRERLSRAEVESIVLDQWTAQKSRFMVRSTFGEEYAIALKRNHRLRDGDILEYDAERQRGVVVRLDFGEVMVIDCGELQCLAPEKIIPTAVELGHALGNQHWPAVVKDHLIYVPLTVDRKVMRSVMQTHNIPHVKVEFRPANEVIPYLAPNEIRELFGGAEQREHLTHHHTPHTHYEHR